MMDTYTFILVEQVQHNVNIQFQAVTHIANKKAGGSVVTKQEVLATDRVVCTCM